MAKINDTTTYPNTAPALTDHVPGTDVSNTTNDAAGESVTFTMQAVMDLFEANIVLTESNISDLGTYLANVSEDTTPTLGGDLAAGGNNVTDLGDVTFQTGASGGTLRTGTSNADKFTLQAYDVNGTAYQTVLELDAGNEPILQLRADFLEIDDETDGTKKVTWDVSGATTGTATDLAFVQTAARTITFPDATGTVQLQPSEGAFANGDKTKLDGIETAADVTDAANVETAIEAITFAAVSGATGDEVMIIDATDGGLKAVLWENLPSGTGDAWGDVVDADIVPDADGTRDLGATATRFANLHVDSIDLNGVTLDGTTLADPGADRLLFWDDSASTTAYLTAGAGLTITATTIAADAVEGTAIVSTGEAGGTKFLREDGDGTCSWQAIGAGGTVDTSGTPVLNDFARFTDANTIEGRSYAEVRTDLGLVIGTDVQAFDANLPTWPATVDATEVGHLNGVTSAIQTQLDAKAPIADPTFTGEIGIGAVNVSETELGILEGATLDTTELNYVDGVTSAIQTQLDAKAALGANTFTGTQDFNGQQVEGMANKVVTSVTGALTMADHSGNVLKTSGNVTVPTTAGFNAVIIAGGAHTVTFNATTSAAMATGDVMTVVVESSTIIHAVLTAAADKVTFT